MFGREEKEILCRSEVRKAIDENIARDSVAIALDRNIPYSSEVATQVLRLQRAATKLPSYYAARAILPPLAYEQSSSEECAARKLLEGDTALDLTCGLGVDSLALSRRFRRVVAVERNETVADVARENFRRLGATNIEVVTASAEEYLASCNEHFDWCFIDPDRRGEKGEKLVRLEDCSPNILALRGEVAKVARRLCVKCSPLFDIDEGFRLWGDCRIEVVSLRGECKEVNIYTGEATPTLAAVAIGEGEFSAPYPATPTWSEAPTDFEAYRYLTLPDVALQHARLVGMAFRGKAEVWSDNGVALSTQYPDGVLGRTYPIEEVVRFDEKILRKRLKGSRIEILKRGFPLATAEICRRLGIKEGGDARWCFTKIGERRLAFLLGR